MESGAGLAARVSGDWLRHPRRRGRRSWNAPAWSRGLSLRRSFSRGEPRGGGGKVGPLGEPAPYPAHGSQSNAAA